MKAFRKARPFTQVRVQVEPECRLQDGEHPIKKPLSKVPSLLFDLELEDSLATRPGNSDMELLLQRAQGLARAQDAFECSLLQIVRSAREQIESGDVLDVSELADRLRVLGQPVRVRTALGGGWGGECLRNLRHTFININVTDSAGVKAYIVDPRFREQFEVARPSRRYQQLLESIPSEFAGSEERIVPLVNFLCAELAASFIASGQTLPPWRQPASMLSKWRPRRSEDCDPLPKGALIWRSASVYQEHPSIRLEICAQANPTTVAAPAFPATPLPTAVGPAACKSALKANREVCNKDLTVRGGNLFETMQQGRLSTSSTESETILYSVSQLGGEAVAPQACPSLAMREQLGLPPPTGRKPGLDMYLSD